MLYNSDCFLLLLVSLTDASLRSNTLTSQDLTSTSTSMVPTLMSIYFLLIQHVQYSLLRQLFHLLCQASGLPGLVRLTWRVPGQICYIPAPLVEKNSWKRIFFDPYSYANLCLFRTYGLELAPHPLLVPRTVFLHPSSN